MTLLRISWGEGLGKGDVEGGEIVNAPRCETDLYCVHVA
jgi:hypothetical protein